MNPSTLAKLLTRDALAFLKLTSEEREAKAAEVRRWMAGPPKADQPQEASLCA